MNSKRWRSLCCHIRASRELKCILISFSDLYVESIKPSQTNHASVILIQSIGKHDEVKFPTTLVKNTTKFIDFIWGWVYVSMKCGFFMSYICEFIDILENNKLVVLYGHVNIYFFMISVLIYFTNLVTRDQTRTLGNRTKKYFYITHSLTMSNEKHLETIADKHHFQMFGL